MKHFEELLLSLGSSRSTEVLADKHWTLWQAEFRTPVSVVKGNYLYLKSSCPLQEASPKNLSNFTAHCGSDGYQIVVPPRSDLAKDLNSTVKRFRAMSGKTTQALLEEHLLKGIDYRPLEREEHFISPTLRIQGTEQGRDGLQFLTKWLVGQESTPTGAPIGLICADGGIGKTTLARELCESVRRQHPRVLPLLIESSQWKNIASTGFTLDSLWDIAIARRLEHGNLLRSNPAALRVLMQEGLLVVVFDGFDELAALTPDKNRPQEIIAELRELFTPEDEAATARVILTSRSTYWDSIADSVDAAGAIEAFRLSGFDNDQRKAYFQSRLTDPAQRDLAQRLARQVSGAIYTVDARHGVRAEDLNEDRISGTPFILSLIAHFVEGSGGETLSPYDADPLEPLLVGVCRRENIRQDLRIPPERQIAIFEEIFRASGIDIATKDLDLVLQLYDVDDAGVRQRFENHFLLQRVRTDALVARYEVLKVYFVARFLAKGLRKLYSSTPEKEIAQTLSRNATGQSQVAEWLAWQLRKLDADHLLAAIAHAFEIISQPANAQSRHKAAMALCHLISLLVVDDDKRGRTSEFLRLMSAGSYVPGASVRRLTFAGKLRKFDLKEVTFENCSFVDVEFTGCTFSDSTLFRGCIFEGGLDFSKCGDIGGIEVVECRLSVEAELAFSQAKSRLPALEVRHTFAEEALTKALRKFRGDSGFHGIQWRRRQAGANPKNPFNLEVWEALRRTDVVASHEISGVSGGGLHINEERDVRREVQQYLDNGILGPRLQRVLRDIVG